MEQFDITRRVNSRFETVEGLLSAIICKDDLDSSVGIVHFVEFNKSNILKTYKFGKLNYAN